MPISYVIDVPLVIVGSGAQKMNKSNVSYVEVIDPVRHDILFFKHCTVYPLSGQLFTQTAFESVELLGKKPSKYYLSCTCKLSLIASDLTTVCCENFGGCSLNHAIRENSKES